MTDTYNDTTGSRKKFLIPLVVLLLCAVSLTGAGYAYNATVTINGGGADTDEYFTLDLYDGTGAIIVNSDKVYTENVDGLLVTTSKAVTGGAVAIEGALAMEDMTVVLYTGHFRINTNEINNADYATVAASGVSATIDPATIYAKYIDDKWESVDEGTEGAHSFTIGAPGITATTMKFFSDAGCTNEVTIFALDEDYYFQIIVSEFDGDVTETTVTKLDKAEDFAQAVVAALEIKFNFTLTATAVENAAIVTLDANTGDADGVAVFDKAGVLKGEAINMVKAGYHLTGFFTAESAGIKVFNANGTVVNDVADYTDAEGKWIGDDAVTLYAQWEADA